MNFIMYRFFQISSPLQKRYKHRNSSFSLTIAQHYDVPCPFLANRHYFFPSDRFSSRVCRIVLTAFPSHRRPMQKKEIQIAIGVFLLHTSFALHIHSFLSDDASFLSRKLWSSLSARLPLVSLPVLFAFLLWPRAYDA